MKKVVLFIICFSVLFLVSFQDASAAKIAAQKSLTSPKIEKVTFTLYATGKARIASAREVSKSDFSIRKTQDKKVAISLYNPLDLATIELVEAAEPNIAITSQKYTPIMTVEMDARQMNEQMLAMIQQAFDYSSSEIGAGGTVVTFSPSEGFDGTGTISGHYDSQGNYHMDDVGFDVDSSNGDLSGDQYQFVRDDDGNVTGTRQTGDMDVDDDGIANSRDDDIDGDGIPNGNDTDDDGDGTSDEDEEKNGTDPSDDTDDDGECVSGDCDDDEEDDDICRQCDMDGLLDYFWDMFSELTIDELMSSYQLMDFFFVTEQLNHNILTHEQFNQLIDAKAFAETILAQMQTLIQEMVNGFSGGIGVGGLGTWVPTGGLPTSTGGDSDGGGTVIDTGNDTSAIQQERLQIKY
ncbi:MAG: hypothetical protein ABII18_04245 [bacterium]